MRWVHFTLGLAVVMAVTVALLLGAMYLAEGDCILKSHEHEARCR